MRIISVATISSSSSSWISAEPIANAVSCCKAHSCSNRTSSTILAGALPSPRLPSVTRTGLRKEPSCSSLLRVSTLVSLFTAARKVSADRRSVAWAVSERTLKWVLSGYVTFGCRWKPPQSSSFPRLHADLDFLLGDGLANQPNCSSCLACGLFYPESLSGHLPVALTVEPVFPVKQ